MQEALARTGRREARQARESFSRFNPLKTRAGRLRPRSAIPRRDCRCEGQASIGDGCQAGRHLRRPGVATAGARRRRFIASV